MAELPFFPIATDAYLADCAHLSDAEHGRYLMLLMALWRAPSQRLPNDDEWLARRFARDVERIKSEIRPLIKEFCKCSGNWITQKRLSKEFDYVMSSRKKQSARAKSGWNKRKEESPGDAGRQGCGNAPTPTPTPTPINSVPNGTGAKAPTREVIFSEGLPWLVRRSGLDDRACRGIIGKWLKDYGDEPVLAAMQQAEAENPVDPVPWIVSKFKPRETHEQRRLREIREVLQ